MCQIIFHLFKRHNRHACVPRQTLRDGIRPQSFSGGADTDVPRCGGHRCPSSVHDADGFQMGKIGVVQVFIQLCDGLVGGQTQKVDLRGRWSRLSQDPWNRHCDGLSFRRRRLLVAASGTSRRIRSLMLTLEFMMPICTVRSPLRWEERLPFLHIHADHFDGISRCGRCFGTL